MNIYSLHSTPTLGGNLEFTSISERSPMSGFVERHQLTDTLDSLKVAGLCGEDALFAIALTQNLNCWLCDSQKSVTVPVIMPDLKPSRRCAECDCFLEVAQ